MSWKSLAGFASVLFLSCLAAALVFTPAHVADHQFGSASYSFQKYSNLSVEEINRRTLKAAAEIKVSRR